MAIARVQIMAGDLISSHCSEEDEGQRRGELFTACEKINAFEG